MTITLYARRKAWPLREVTVRLRHSRIHAEDCADCETKQGMLDRIEREIAVSGPSLGRAAGEAPRHRGSVSGPPHLDVGDQHPDVARVRPIAVSGRRNLWRPAARSFPALNPHLNSEGALY